MSQRDTLQALDQDLVSAFKSAGLADDALRGGERAWRR